MMPDYLFDSEVVRLAFVLGIILSMALYEWRQLTTGSIVVPGYVGVFILQPSTIVASLVNAILSYWLVHRLLPRLVSMSARTKFSALVVTSVVIQSLAHTFGAVTSDSASMSIFIGVGYVIPALVAHDMARHGVWRSLSAVLGTSVATGMSVVGLAWLAPDITLARPAVVPLQSAFLIDGMFVAVLLSAVSVVVLQSRHRLGAGGFIGPAYLSFLFVHPAQLVFLAVLTPLTYLTTTKLLMPRMILFGRRKFAAMLLVGCLYSWGGMLLLEHGFGADFLPFSSPSLSVISVVLIGLLANDADRVGWAGVARGTALAVTFTLTGTLLVLEAFEQQRLEVLLPLAIVMAAAGLVIFAPLVTRSSKRLFAAAAESASSEPYRQAVVVNIAAATQAMRRSLCAPIPRVSTAVCLVLLIGVAFFPISRETPLFLGAKARSRPHFEGLRTIAVTSRLAKLSRSTAPLPRESTVYLDQAMPSATSHFFTSLFSRSKNHGDNYSSIQLGIQIK